MIIKRKIRNNSFKIFLKNISFLFKNDIRKIFDEEKFFSIIEGLEYQPLIKSPQQTINALVSTNKSFCRLGDGEFQLIKGNSIPFQEYTEELANRLKDILNTANEEIMIGIPYVYFNYTYNLSETVKVFYKEWILANRKEVAKLINLAKQYYDTGCSQMYFTYNNIDLVEYFSHIRKIWANKEVTIICGQTVFDKISHNIFDNAKSVEYLYAPSKNAFNEYDKLLNEALAIEKTKLVIIILGPTATVLAYDLYNQGYRAIDFGHVAKDYSYFCSEVEKNRTTLHEFFDPD